MQANEIHQAILDLTPSELLKLKKYAQWRIRSLGRHSGGRTFEDLLSDAITATLDEKRQWTGNTDLCGHLFGAMRSISTAWRERILPEVYLQSELQGFADESVGVFEQALSTMIDPERILAAKEELERIQKAFSRDSTASDVLNLMAFGYTAREIRVYLSISEDEYAAATKRIHRKLDVLYPERQRRSVLRQGSIVQSASPKKRVEWTEDRDRERIFVIADREGGAWKFSERSTWETSWYDIPSTPQLEAQAERLAREHVSGFGTSLVPECADHVFTHGPEPVPLQ